MVDDLVATAGDAVEVGVRVDEVDAVVDEARPVEFNDGVEIGDQLLAVVRDDERAGVAALAEEDVEEVGEGFLVVGELADLGVGIEPEELAFLVVVLTPTPVGPGGTVGAEDAGGDGGVFGGTPLAAGLVIQIGGVEGEDVAVGGLGLEVGARGKDVAEILPSALLAGPRAASPAASWRSRPGRELKGRRYLPFQQE